MKHVSFRGTVFTSLQINPTGLMWILLLRYFFWNSVRIRQTVSTNGFYNAWNFTTVCSEKTPTHIFFHISM